MENKSNKNKKETTFSALDFLITVESKNNQPTTPSVQETLTTTQSGSKKLIINNTNDFSLAQLASLGLSGEILNEVSSSNFDDIKNKQAEIAEKIWKEKETQKNSTLSDVKFNPITGTFDAVISGIKFNPLTGGFDVSENLIKDLKNGVVNQVVEEKSNQEVQKILTTSSSDLSASAGIKFNPLTGGFDFSDSLLKDLKNGVINNAVEEKANYEIQKTTTSGQYQSIVNPEDKNNISENKQSNQKNDNSNNINLNLGNLVFDILKNDIDNEKESSIKETTILADITKETNDFATQAPEKNKLPLDKPVFNPEKPLPINTSKLGSVFSKVNKPDLPKLVPNVVNSNEVPKNKNINVSTTIEYSDKEKSELKNLFEINEDTGVFLDITLNITKKEDAINILNQHSKSKYLTSTIDSVLFYEDRGVNLYLENNVVKEFEFKGNFDGSTSKGLKLGDTIEQAIKLYGKPTIMTNKGAVWRNIKVFLDKNLVNSIKIQK